MFHIEPAVAPCRHWERCCVEGHRQWFSDGALGFDRRVKRWRRLSCCKCFGAAAGNLPPMDADCLEAVDQILFVQKAPQFIYIRWMGAFGVRALLSLVACCVRKSNIRHKNKRAVLQDGAQPFWYIMGGCVVNLITLIGDKQCSFTLK